MNVVSVCSCLLDYRFQIISFDCHHEYKNDSECINHLNYSSFFKCKNPCKYDKNTEYLVVDHQAKYIYPNVSFTLKS